jgi:hypothetical protein
MARNRTATEIVNVLDRPAITRALNASVAAGSMEAFYSVVGMRNPSRSYFVRYRRRLHSLKAIATYAVREVRPSATSRDFHAADAADRLRHLRFDVVHNLEAVDLAREREWLSRLSRPQQAAFRSKLIDLYGGCALTGCTTVAALEAAHVRTVAAGGHDQASNGILLRADLHKLFDANLIAIDPRTGAIRVARTCKPDYGRLVSGIRFKSPRGGPRLKDFQQRWDAFSDE